MAEGNTFNAPFPAPPPSYKHFTKQNLSRLRRTRKEAGIPPPADGQPPEKDVDILTLPAELRYLVPPEPPSDSKLTVFGDTVNLDAPRVTLADNSIEQIYPDDPSVLSNPQPHLIALARSMLTTFLSLTGILAQNPDLQQDKMGDLQTIVYNLHDIINQYRPHQARESLILMMEERLEKMKGEIQRIDQSKESVAKLLQELQSNGIVQAMQEEKDGKGDAVVEDAAVTKRKARQRAGWAALENEMG
ncbi:hypothetical protein M409DRAFT_71167 [Zasmidium cellare ATCC 36951]|uniref:Mediator of RNA polymerase II transcription subunit 7 n=1 Tax=Zasmidium cellare ATCC 36951 TaxID=1080233 RepID=A0A6A6BWU4_ZASCE|nr:uncharacterized protein M409DRAFT_71167 [Zasmidium cellare ATCC 36951]KAF2159281.1 hypothetical protein M409DRAFT_71167 [Zasmidium cellare ATCC 36951]